MTCHGCHSDCERHGRDRYGHRRYRCRQCSKTGIPSVRPDGVWATMHHMELKLEQVRPEDLDEVVGFLRRVFQAPPNAHFLQTDHVQWKFFEPRPDWDGSRS